MKNLPMAEETSRSDSATASSVNLRFFFSVLGVIVLVPSLLFLGWAVSKHPRPVDVTKKQVMFTYGRNTVIQDSTSLPPYERDVLTMHTEHIDYMPPFQAYLYFRTLKNGPVLSYNFQENYQMLKDAYQIRVSAAAICVGLGLLSLVVSWFMPQQTKSVGLRKGAEWK